MIAGASWVWWVGFHAVVAALLAADSLLPGHSRLLPVTERLPQMQWNIVRHVQGRSSRLLGDAGGSPLWFYFVHSYAPMMSGEAEPSVVGVCEYGGPVVAAVEQGSLFGTQFHPEKSGKSGLELLRRFASLCGPK